MNDPGEAMRGRYTLVPAPPAPRTEIIVERGALERLPELIAEWAPAFAYAVVSDRTVAGLYGEAVAERLAAQGRVARLFPFPEGETSKTPERWTDLLESFAGMGLGRDGCVVAVGGGVTGDLAGFAASAYGRGVALVQVPTSLLAMIDASIGGKTGIDLRAGKNLAGSFHHPRLVAVDPETLSTLPDAELRNGLAEAVKHAAIAEADALGFLERDADAILDLDPEALDRLIRESIGVKTAVVGRDAVEAGERAVLNFGHTIGHGLERVTGYAIPHGQAVAMGLVVEARIGEGIGVTEPGTSHRLRTVLDALGLPTAVPGHVDREALVEATRSDKKGRGGRVRYTLIAAPGQPARTADGAWTHAVSDSDALAAINPADRAPESV
jgi:3-dehydroquinate synthase